MYRAYRAGARKAAMVTTAICMISNLKLMMEQVETGSCAGEVSYNNAAEHFLYLSVPLKKICKHVLAS